MDSSQWTQEYGVAKAAMGDVGGQSACTRPAAVMERKVSRPQKDQVINCPRCQSTNTKFCYYNNYSLTQPRYFCKTCRRYWTEGGTLRNVPVGGGSRKNKRSSSSSSHVSPAASSNKLNLPDLNPPTINSHHFSSHQNPKSIHDNDHGQDLNLGFQAPHQDYHHHHHHHHGNIPQFLEFPKIIHNNRDLNSPNNNNNNNNNNNSSSSTASPLSALNFLRSGIGSYNPNTFIPMAPISNVDQANALFASGFPFQECKPSSLAFTFDAGNPNNQGQPENSNGTLMFTLGSAAAKQQHSSTSGDHDQEKVGHGNGNGYWNGMLGGGGSW